MYNNEQNPEERLTTTDEHGHRIYVHPEDVKGVWRNRRTIFYWFLILLYLILPWTYIKGKQTILLDIVHREFTFFGTTFYAHDAPMVLLFILMFIFSMGFITSMWGRAWCGWACPQTVFIDILYRKVEQLIEGKARARAKLEKESFSIKKLFKKILKWFIFLIISLHIAHSFLGYFVGTYELFEISLHRPAENWTLFIFMIAITGICLFDFGWFREQFCLIACPYGRIQSVMMDERSLTVSYDHKRGEPKRSGSPQENDGDCISCNHCVKVCPTGIDIRNGNQLECIACTQCIDACDSIMTKVNKPTGLIRYASEAEIEGMNSVTDKPRLRPYLYLSVIFILLGIFIYAINESQKLHVTLIKSSDTPYSMTPQNEVLNLYRLRFDYTGAREKKIIFTMKDSSLPIKIFTPRTPYVLKKSGSQTTIIHFRYPPSILNNGSKKVYLLIQDANKKLILEKEVQLVGPFH